MSKLIRVSDETYESLKKEADKSLRSLGNQIEYLMTYRGTGKALSKKKPREDAPGRMLDEISPGELVPREEPKFKLTGKLCKEHKVDVSICKNMKH